MTFPEGTPLAIALLGFGLGMRHATDADHVVAVTTIVSTEGRIATAVRIGLTWGIGHTLTVFTVGAAIILFKLAIPARIGLMMEFAVALALIALGIPAVGRLFSHPGQRSTVDHAPSSSSPLVHSHPHYHDGHQHSHPHAHKAPSVEHRDHRIGFYRRLATSYPLAKAFSVGLVHGLAGSAAVALLVLSAIPDPNWAVVYLLVFGAGTICGMMLITTVVGMPFAYAQERTAGFHRVLVLGSGILSFGFGLFLAYHIGIVDGLFGASPMWRPH
ncbi:MAG TPA: hypothetical protein VEF03_02525 [Candidatus Binataceae bacterium]|nr:hypothetical protein [Candidatus Binataceae bacterium]